MAMQDSYYARIPSLCMAEGIEGYLEKKSTGYIKTKTKYWCFLQGPFLYMQKNENDVMSNLNLCDANTVRRLASDSTHFEIQIKKKNHVFACQTKEECSTWIKALQSAMTLKDSRRDSSSSFFVEHPDNSQSPREDDDSSNLYATINDHNGSERGFSQSGISQNALQQQNTTSMNNARQENTSASNSGSQGRACSETGNPSLNSAYANEAGDAGVKQECQASARSVTEGSNDQALTASGENAEQQTYTNEMIVEENRVSINSKNSDKGENVYQEVNPLVVMPERSPVPEEEASVYQQVDEIVVVPRKGSRCDLAMQQSLRGGGESGSDDSVEDEEEAGDLLNELSNSLDDNIWPLPEFLHPLTEEDRKPVEDLQTFLNNNRDMCRPARTSLTNPTTDPLASLKEYLENLQTI